MAKARSWLNQHLSYVGRLQLLNSVLFSIQVYLSCLFILPKVVIVNLFIEVFPMEGSLMCCE